MLMPFATVSRSSNITGHDMGVLGQRFCFNVVGVSSRRTPDHTGDRTKKPARWNLQSFGVARRRMGGPCTRRASAPGCEPLRADYDRRIHARRLRIA
jgi:hypothetical protein